MAYGEIRAIDWSCRSYRLGHHPHWIQAKKAVEEDQPVVDVAITVHDDGRVVLAGDDPNLTMRNHDPVRLRSGVDHCGRAVWKPRHHVLSVPGLFGYVFNLDALDERTECWPGPPKSAPLATVQYEQRKLSSPEAEVADAVAHCHHGPIPRSWASSQQRQVVHVLLFARRQAGIGLA